MATLTITQPVTLELPPMSEDGFYDFCRRNRDLRVERTAEGEVIVMAPAFGETGRKNSSINAQVYIWAEADGRGETFDSSTGFTLPNGAIRSPDAAWVSNARLDATSESDLENAFPHVCPEFVIELLSRSDSRPEAERKMREWIENGAELGWLIDPYQRVVHEYTRDGMRLFDNFLEMEGHGPAAGFILNLGKIWKRRE